MKTVVEVQSHIETQAVNNSNETRVVEKMEVGEGIRQGDVYIWKVSEIPSDYSIPTMERQIAQGDTKGSRHILEETTSLRIFKKSTPSPLDGPAFTSVEDIVLTHPEHADFVIKGGGCFISEYQQDFAAEEIRAVRD